MRKPTLAVLPLKSIGSFCVTRLKIEENLLWGQVKFKSTWKGYT
jgi:hypothetical protein